MPGDLLGVVDYGHPGVFGVEPFLDFFIAVFKDVFYKSGEG
jgi:hypothetical protein